MAAELQQQRAFGAQSPDAALQQQRSIQVPPAQKGATINAPPTTTSPDLTTPDRRSPQ
jgi:hypothetical protein